MSAVLMTTATEHKMKCSNGKGPCFTFQDINTLLVGRVGVGVVWRCEHPAIDVADPRTTLVLVRALAAMITWGILKQKGREQTNRWVIESGDQ